MKRETHTQYTYFNRQPNRKKEKRKTNKLLATIKRKHTIKNGVLQITFYQ